MSLTIKFYDVEHGSCTHIITPNGKHFLVDIGTKSDKSICQHIKANHLKYGARIDYLIITHPHADHIADIEGLYSYGIKPLALRRSQEAYPLQVVSADTEAKKAVKKRANEMNVEYCFPVTIDPAQPDNNGGIEIIFFDPIVSDSEKCDINNFSNVIVMNYAGFKIVLTGDNPASKLSSMLSQYGFQQAIADATVLLAPHHGRDSDYCEEFVKAVSPLVTVFSDKSIQYETQAHAAQKYYTYTRGVPLNGNNRYVFTTRSDGTITFTFKNDGNWSIDTSTTEY